MKRQKKIILFAGVAVILIGAASWSLLRRFDRYRLPWMSDAYTAGNALESVDGVVVYDNGPDFTQAHGPYDYPHFPESFESVMVNNVILTTHVRRS